MVTANLSLASLSNQMDWELVDSEILVPSPLNYMNDYNVILDAPILTIGVKSKYYRRNWKFGGWAYQKLLYIPSMNSNFGNRVVSQRQYLRLGELNLIKFEDYGVGLAYQLSIEFPQWLKEIELEVWKYVR